MLVLSRKCLEEIAIGDAISIRILSCGRNRVRIGISAPHDVAIRRMSPGVREQPQDSTELSDGRTLATAAAMTSDAGDAVCS